MSRQTRVGMWSGPRNVSTAMMRSFENREDTVVVDEPFYAAYLVRTGIDHPGRASVIASQPTDPAEVVARLRGPLQDGVTVHYAKQMSHHLAADQDLEWTHDFRNVLLVRDPAEVVSSYVRSREACEPEDIGLWQQVRLLEQLHSSALAVELGTRRQHLDQVVDAERGARLDEHPVVGHPVPLELGEGDPLRHAPEPHAEPVGVTGDGLDRAAGRVGLRRP